LLKKGESNRKELLPRRLPRTKKKVSAITAIISVGLKKGKEREG